MIDVTKDMLYNDEPASLNERLFQEEPIIAGRKVRPWNNAVKLKLARIFSWISDLDQSTQHEELLYAFLYLVAAPIERVALNTLNKKAYFIDKDEFVGSLSEQEIASGGKWFITVTNLEKETTVEVVAKPSSGTGETPPPNL